MMPTQQTHQVDTKMFYCWANVADVGPTLKHNCFSVSSLLGSLLKAHFFSPESTHTMHEAGYDAYMAGYGK